ncbi:MAG TPA: hypothetical protein VGO24_00425 [Solirubrobacterales bacterium]|jgi:hypothetical protein|nr:hypothetical protein [Solirubrobacterales bacterium]
MAAKGIGALLAMMVALVLATTPAEAKPGYFEFPGYEESQLTLSGTHGYRISVTRTGHRVELVASRHNGAAIYIVPATRSLDQGIEATFPGRGRVSVRLQTVGRPKRSAPFPGCSGGGTVEWRGLFVGTIRFEGEHGFTRVAARHARGRISQGHREVCKKSEETKGRPAPGLSLLAYRKAHGRTIAFSAFRQTSEDIEGSLPWFFASVAERLRGMQILRVLFSRDAGPSSFAVAGPVARPTSASVVPPPPFRGTATFNGTPEGQAAWEGTLEADLPGASEVKLAGPSFASSLCLLHRCAGQPRPESGRRARLLAQGSGSHSQALADARLSWSR